jgi:uncharacterized membrane protein (DUF2068 family)
MSKERSHRKWELRACGRKGHATYRPTEAALAARLRADTPQGEAWRCLRCGDYVVGPPAGTGPADEAPIVLRGKALRDATILRILSVERFLRGIVLLLAAVAIERFKSDQGSLQQLFEKDLPALRSFAANFHIDVDANAITRTINHVLYTKQKTLTLVAILVAAYAAVELVEAVGLWLLKRWGEYFTVVATAAFLPIEVFELTHHVTITKLLALLVNIAAVVYLVVAKRLFGVRGGEEAFRREREGESLWEVEQSGDSTSAPVAGSAVEHHAEQQRAEGGEGAERAPDGEAGAGAGALVQERADP